MATIFLEVAVRAALIASGTAFVLWALRIKTAAMRHAAWTAVLLTMLVLPIWLAADLRVSVPVLPPASAAIADQTIDSGTALPGIPLVVAPEASSLAAPIHREVPGSANWQDVFAGTYVLGALVLLARLLLGTVKANHLRRHAAVENGRLTSGRCATPITVGWFRPALILPPDWPRWSAAKLAAVLTHEAEHARRHDPLVQWVALLNRAVFWFHPLSWWLERQLAILSEEACDAAVITAGHSPEDYSRYLLDLARSMTREGRRLNVVGVAMPGSGLKERLRHVCDGVPLTPISRARLVAAATLCVASTVLFAGTTLTPRTSMSIGAGAPSGAQAATGTAPKFEVVSVKPCDPNNLGSGGSRSGGAGPVSPGRLVENCLTLYNMIQNAYIRFADGRDHDPWGIRDTSIEGGPDWIRHDPYMVEATADGTASQTIMRGPMLQAVLEDRFHLKLHHDSRQGQVYDLVVAPNGSKLKPAKDGVCVQPDWTVFPMPPLPDDQHRCAITLKRFDANGKEVAGSRIETSTYTLTWDDEAMSLDDLARDFLLLDRPVVNKTGIAGLVSFHLTHQGDRTNAPDRWPNSYADVAAAELKAQLGLELRPSTGFLDSLIIDRVERPTPNEQVGLAPPSGAQASPVQSARFDVASVKECAPNSFPPPGQRGASAPSSPGYLFLNCLTLRQLVNMSSGHADDKLNILLRYRLANEFYPVEGGPSWVGTAGFTIEARANGVTDRNILTGPMLRALLEERFQLKTHAATKDQPVYLLKLAADGLKLQPVASDSCYEIDPANLAVSVRGKSPLCGVQTSRVPFKAVAEKIGKAPKAEGTSLSDHLSYLMDRAVIDQTGLDARYDVAFEYTPDETTPGAGLNGGPPAAGSGPNIFKALAQLGLKLEPAKWPVPYLVVDHAEKPRPNSPSDVVYVPGRTNRAGGGR